MKKKWILLLLVVIVTALLFISRSWNASSYTTILTIDDIALRVAVADTDAERTQGLSNTKPLASDEGMLFVFDAPGVQTFWMKDMNYSLDIIWIGEDKIVKKITENATPDSYPDTLFSSDVPVKYVLEVRSGFSKENNIQVGDIISF